MKIVNIAKPVVFLSFLVVVWWLTKTYAERIHNNKRTESKNVQQGIIYKNILEDFDYLEGEVSFKGNKFTIRGIRFNPKKYRTEVMGLNPKTLSGYSIGGFLNRANALTAISGGFRSVQNLPFGLVITDKKVANRLDKDAEWLNGILVIRRNEVLTIHRDEYKTSNYDYALQSGPLILKDGTNQIDKRKKGDAPQSRSFIALQRTGGVILAITSAVHLYDLAEFLTAPDGGKGLNCEAALNLEGGGREGLSIKAGGLQKSFGTVGVRRPNALIVKSILDWVHSVLPSRTSSTAHRIEAISTLNKVNNIRDLGQDELNSATLAAIVYFCLHPNRTLRSLANKFIKIHPSWKLEEQLARALAKAPIGSTQARALAQMNFDVLFELGMREKNQYVNRKNGDRQRIEKAASAFKKAWELKSLKPPENRLKALYGWAHALYERSQNERQPDRAPNPDLVRAAQEKFSYFLRELGKVGKAYPYHSEHLNQTQEYLKRLERSF